MLHTGYGCARFALSSGGLWWFLFSLLCVFLFISSWTKKPRFFWVNYPKYISLTGCKSLAYETAAESREEWWGCPQPVTVAGWIRTTRDQRAMVFVELNDGSGPGSLQVTP